MNFNLTTYGDWPGAVAMGCRLSDRNRLVAVSGHSAV